MDPLGLAMLIGCEVGRLLTTAAVTVQKWAVLPESAIARPSGGIIVGGGPTKTEDKLNKPDLLETFSGMCGGSVVFSIGSPRRQLAAGEEGRPRAREVEEGAGEAIRRGRPEEIVLFPPRIRKAVASS